MTQNAQLREARQAMGWSQDELARVMGVATQTVYMWERGTVPRKAMQKRLARKLRTTLEGLGYVDVR